MVRGGASGALGALIAGNLKTPRRRIRTKWSHWTVAALAPLLFAVATHYWEVLLVPLLVTPLALMGNVIWESMLQSEVPRELLGRVSSVDFFVSLGLSPLGLIAAGSLTAAIGVRSYFVLIAIAASLPGLYILASRRINEVDRDRVTPGAGAAPWPEAVGPDENPS